MTLPQEYIVVIRTGIPNVGASMIWLFPRYIATWKMPDCVPFEDQKTRSPGWADPTGTCVPCVY